MYPKQNDLYYLKKKKNKILHVIHWDLNDLIAHVSLNNFKYTLCFFFNNLLGLITVYFLKQKKMLLDIMKYLVDIALYGYVKCI